MSLRSIFNQLNSDENPNFHNQRLYTQELVTKGKDKVMIFKLYCKTEVNPWDLYASEFNGYFWFWFNIGGGFTCRAMSDNFIIWSEKDEPEQRGFNCDFAGATLYPKTVPAGAIRDLVNPHYWDNTIRNFQFNYTKQVDGYYYSTTSIAAVLFDEFAEQNPMPENSSIQLWVMKQSSPQRGNVLYSDVFERVIQNDQRLKEYPIS